VVVLEEGENVSSKSSAGKYSRNSSDLISNFWKTVEDGNDVNKLFKGAEIKGSETIGTETADIGVANNVVETEGIEPINDGEEPMFTFGILLKLVGGEINIGVGTKFSPINPLLFRSSTTPLTLGLDDSCKSFLKFSVLNIEGIFEILKEIVQTVNINTIKTIRK